MAYADVLFLDDCSDASDEVSGHDIEQAVKELVHPTTRKAAVHALSAHPYASDDLVNSPAWPAFCSSLSAVLADFDIEVSSAAIAFAEKVFREVRCSKPLELADLCLALAGHICIGQDGVGLGPISEAEPPPDSTSAKGSGPQTAAHRAPVGGDSAGDRAAVRAAAVRLLLGCLRALPRVWATFRDPLLQQLWDAVCPLLKLGLRSSADSAMQQPDNIAPAAQQHTMHCQAAGSHDGLTECGDDPSLSHAASKESPLNGGCVDAVQRRRHVGQAVAPRQHAAGELCGPLVELCWAEGWSGDWWKAWTAPARPAKWLPGALQKHGILPGLIEVCGQLAKSVERCRKASAAEAFAVQVVGSVLALSLGRKLFPISSAIVTTLPQLVTVQDAIMCLSKIGTQPLRAGVSGVDHHCPAAQVAQDALQLLCRDDGPDFRILAPRNVIFMAVQLELAKQCPSRNSSIEEVQRRLDAMLALLNRTAYGRNLLCALDR